MRGLYLVAAVAGTVLPYGSFLPFFRENGLDVGAFVGHAFANPVAAGFGWDVIVSSVAFWGFAFTEARRQSMKHVWLYVACNLLVGLSLALPLFLLAREARVGPTPARG